MSRHLTLLLVLVGLQANAQNWCAPGAEWTYHFGNQQASGITRAWYSGDSLVGGYTAQRIEQTIHAYQANPPFGQPFTQQLEPLYTRFADEVVLIWDQWSNTYDTLIWFGAVPGQYWNLHHQDEFTWFTVLDTGTSMVDGIPLRYLVVEEPNFLFATDTIRERIGSDYFYIDPMETLMVDWTTGWLRCYRDSAIDEFHGRSLTWTGDCDFTVQVPDPLGAFIQPYPNPGADQFTLSLPPGSHRITMHDATGRIVLQQRSRGERTSIDTAMLAPGMYVVLVDEGPQRATWLKR